MSQTNSLSVRGVEKVSLYRQVRCVEKEIRNGESQLSAFVLWLMFSLFSQMVLFLLWKVSSDSYKSCQKCELLLYFTDFFFLLSSKN